jgi:Hydantoinase/oxoprolinase C-terminal domain
LDEFLIAPVYALDRLVPGQPIDGPAIIESAVTTILLRPRERAITMPLGWLDIALPEASHPSHLMLAPRRRKWCPSV